MCLISVGGDYPAALSIHVNTNVYVHFKISAKADSCNLHVSKSEHVYQLAMDSSSSIMGSVANSIDNCWVYR